MRQTLRDARTLVVNFNAPELNQLAVGLARAGQLAHFVRPYINRGRPWERLLARTPGAGALYARTFGRRRLPDPALGPLTREAGVVPDLLAAALARLPGLTDQRRHAGTTALFMQVREAVARRAAQLVSAGACDCVVGYEGFALPAFEALRAQGGDGLCLLNYPVAHHRYRRRRRNEELALQPAFAGTWPGFDDWGPGHEARLDAEIAQAHAILVGSHYVAQTFIDEGVPAHKLHVVPYGVDLATFHTRRAADEPATQREQFRVIYAGQLTQRKGLSYLLDGYARFRQPDSLLSLVGSTVGEGAALRARLASEGVEHLPHQTRPDLARRYRAADVFLFPTLVEGMPLVVLEAMACGLPVIVTRNGPGELVRDGVDGLVVPERDPGAIAAALTRLHADAALRQRMGAAAAERARAYDWSRYTAQALGVIAQMRAGQGIAA